MEDGFVRVREKDAMARVKGFLESKHLPDPSSRFAKTWPRPMDLHNDLQALIDIIERRT